MANWRTARINEDVRRDIEEIIRTMKDPGIQSMVSVTRAEVTRDLAFAKIYVSVLGTEKQKQSVFEALKRANGYIRHALAERANLRRTPALLFEQDDSIAYAVHLSSVIDKVRQDDENK